MAVAIPAIPSTAIIESVTAYLWMDDPSLTVEECLDSKYIRHLTHELDVFKGMARDACSSALDYCTCELIAATSTARKVNTDDLACAIVGWVRANMSRHYEAKCFEDIPSEARSLLNEVAQRQRGRASQRQRRHHRSH